jgi:putative ABC transport system permease protein
MYSLIQDFRFSLRLMRKRPGMTFLVIAALVLGIGANSAVFTVVNAVLLRPFPLPHPDRLVVIWATSKQTPDMGVSYPDYLNWKEQSHSFQSMATFQPISFNMTGQGPAEHLKGFKASASFFKVLGLPPALGRDFAEEDDRPGATRVAIISRGFWERRFGSDPAILGKTLILNAQPYTVVGVEPDRPFYWIRGFDVWVPQGLFIDQKVMNRETRYLGVVARLGPWATRAQAQAEIEAIAGRLAVEYPQSNKDIGVAVVGLAELFTVKGRRPLLLLLSASGLFLVLASINVVTVFVSNAMERRKELSVRLALGAERSMLLRQMFVQSFLFALLSGSLGLAIAKAAVAFLVNRFPYLLARFQETNVDRSVVLFTIGTALLVSLISSLLPALYIFKLNINSELKGEWTWSALSRYRAFGQSALIVFEVSLAASLALVSGLLIKSFHEVEKVDLGFKPDRVLSFQVSLPPARYEEADRIAAFYKQAIQKIRNIPGVRSASAISTLPLSGAAHFINLQVESGQTEIATQRPFVDSPSVLPGYFETLRSPILQGRDFKDTDTMKAPAVAIVDEVLATRMWPGQSPLGKRIRLADIGDNGPPWREVVGVVHQVKHYGPEKEVPRMQVYVPLFQQPTPLMSFVVDFLADQRSIRTGAEVAIFELDKDLPLDNFRTLEDLLSFYVSGREVSVLLLGSFAGIGITLCMIGIYGVVSNSVVRMRRELAIRMALGATVGNAIVLVVKVGLIGALGGILVGSAIVLSLTRVLTTFLFGVTPLDFSLYLFSAVLIIVLALVACLVPAQSVLRLNPQDVLREH